MEKMLDVRFFRDGKDLIVQFKDVDVTQEQIIRNLFATTNTMPTEQVKSLEPLKEEDTLPVIPAFIQEETPVQPETKVETPADDIKENDDELGKYVFKQGKCKGMTLDEIYKKDRNYLNFILDKCQNTPTYKEVYPIVKQYMDEKK